MATDYKFEGWIGHDASAAEGKLVWEEFEPKPWEETDIDVKVSHCGVCGTDLHTLRSGWGPSLYPCCPGHEIVGTVVRVGSKTDGSIKLGDRVGVPPVVDACDECAACKAGLPNQCPTATWGYSAKHRNGATSMGGYATYERCPARFVVKVPDELSSSHAAPMLCAGVTAYSALKRLGCAPGKSVGIVGLGGIGQFGILFAKALGADKVVAVSRSARKAADALAIGADEFIATDDDPEVVKRYFGTLDIVISTVDSPSAPFSTYIQLVAFNGQFCTLGGPEGNLTIAWFPLMANRVTLSSALIGTADETREMLQLAVEKNVKPWVEERPLSEANQVLLDMDAGKAKYRYVLVHPA